MRPEYSRPWRLSGESAAGQRGWQDLNKHQEHSSSPTGQTPAGDVMGWHGLRGCSTAIWPGSAPLIFTVVADLLQWIMQQRGTLHMAHYYQVQCQLYCIDKTGVTLFSGHSHPANLQRRKVVGTPA